MYISRRACLFVIEEQRDGGNVKQQHKHKHKSQWSWWRANDNDDHNADDADEATATAADTNADTDAVAVAIAATHMQSAAARLTFRMHCKITRNWEYDKTNSAFDKMQRPPKHKL